MWKYIPTLATAFLAVLQLAKDWGAHQTTWRRAGVLSLIMCLGVGGAINTYYSDRKVAAQHAADQRQIGELQKAVETANTAQANNTRQFVQSFSGLSQQLSALQSQVNNARLQKEATRLRAELESTQKALTPEKAEIESSLGVISDTLENIGVKDVSVSKQPDDTVAFNLTVVNKSAVQARNGSVFLRICEGCEFAEEPKRFTRSPGADVYDREMRFEALNATTGLAVPLKVKVSHRA